MDSRGPGKPSTYQYCKNVVILKANSTSVYILIYNRPGNDLFVDFPAYKAMLAREINDPIIARLVNCPTFRDFGSAGIIYIMAHIYAFYSAVGFLGPEPRFNRI